MLVRNPGILYTKVWTSADIFLLWYHVCSPRTIQELFSSMTLQEYAIYPVKQNIVDTFDSIQETLFPYKQGVKAGATTTNWQSNYNDVACQVPYSYTEAEGFVRIVLYRVATKCMRWIRSPGCFLGFFLGSAVWYLEAYAIGRDVGVHGVSTCQVPSFKFPWQSTEVRLEPKVMGSCIRNGRPCIMFLLLIDCVQFFGVYSRTARTARTVYW